MYLLLSPAKNLNQHVPLPTFVTDTTMPALIDQSKHIAHALKALDVIDTQELMSVSGAIAQTNVIRHQNWQYPFDDTAKPALYLFDGDAYKGLNAYELSAKEVAYLNEHLGILSGLYGLLRPLDSIMPYRLEMGTKLKVNTHSDLYRFWGDTLTKLLNTRLTHLNSRHLINLASQEYFKAINPKQVNATIISPKFLDKKGNDYKMVSFYAKRARGLMTRFCAVNQIDHPNDLKGFDMENYYFCPTQSTETTWVFLRDEPI